MKDNSLSGKVVLTTGASSGIGAAFAREAAARGAFSLLVGRNAGKLAMVEDSIRCRGGRSKAYVANLTAACDIEALQSHVTKFQFSAPARFVFPSIADASSTWFGMRSAAMTTRLRSARSCNSLPHCGMSTRQGPRVSPTG
jgi:NAD(P)-dependent dehydrogenase (short-subunit alcohol dehydrogenase family)